MNTTWTGKKGLSADLLIDDYPGNLKDFVENGIGKKGIMLSQPWNTTCNELSVLNKAGELVVAANWKEIMTIIFIRVRWLLDHKMIVPMELAPWGLSAEAESNNTTRRDNRKSHYFLLANEARFFEVLCDLLVPRGVDSKVEPGANDVGAVNYVDSELSSFPSEVQEYYTDPIKLVDKLSNRIFGSGTFAGLSSGTDRSVVLREFYLDPTTRERMFDLRSLVLEGFYSDYHDPWYEGLTAWSFVGFSGRCISDLKKN